jgi:hypothetical protein
VLHGALRACCFRSWAFTRLLQVRPPEAVKSRAASKAAELIVETSKMTPSKKQNKINDLSMVQFSNGCGIQKSAKTQD